MGVLESADELPADIEEYSLLMLDTNDVRNIGAGRPPSCFRACASTSSLTTTSRTEAVSWRQLHPQGRLLHLRDPVPAHAGDERARRPLDWRRRCTPGSCTTRAASSIPRQRRVTFEIARDLVATGVEPNDVYARIYESNSISALVLQSARARHPRAGLCQPRGDLDNAPPDDP